jgi:hypothetical protein
MAEHDVDPIRQLEQFVTSGIAVAPLPPGEVRRRGDRRRAQRRTAGAALVAAAIAAVAIPVALHTTGGSDAGRHIAGTPTPAPTATPTSTPGTTQIITFPHGGVDVRTPADATKLTGTTQAFQDFIGAQETRLRSDATDNCSAALRSLTVMKYDSAGFAIGAVNDCGGYQALWAMSPETGIWSEALGTQDTWDCDGLRYLGVPKSFAGTCFDYAGTFGPNDVDGLRLGMTQAQVLAAGATFVGDPSGACAGFRLPRSTRPPGQADGFFSAGSGVVTFQARTGEKTDKKIGLGSTAAEVRAAYPAGAPGANGFWKVTLGGGAAYEFSIGSGTVQVMVLVGPHQDPGTPGACLS